MRRRKARELAFKMLYQVETNGDDPELALLKYCEIFPYDADILLYVKSLLAGLKQQRTAIDTFIEGACDNWRLDRITYVDRSILRLSVYEMLFVPDIPPKVAMDEAIELAKKYGNEDSREFVNGVMDRVFRDFYEEKERKKR